MYHLTQYDIKTPSTHYGCYAVFGLDGAMPKPQRPRPRLCIHILPLFRVLSNLNPLKI